MTFWTCDLQQVEDDLVEGAEQFVDAAAGFDDAALDVLNPFDNFVSIPDIGPVFGH